MKWKCWFKHDWSQWVEVAYTGGCASRYCRRCHKYTMKGGYKPSWFRFPT